VEDIRNEVDAFDTKSLTYPWSHRNPAMDHLCEELQDTVAAAENAKASRAAIFEKIWSAANRAAERHVPLPMSAALPAVPYLNEPWYC